MVIAGQDVWMKNVLLVILEGRIGSGMMLKI